MGLHWIRRPLSSPGAQMRPNITSTQYTTAYGPATIIPFKTSGSPGLNRVVKITSSGTVKPTTGSSGRRAVGVVIATGTTARVLVAGFAFVLSSSAALAKGAYIVATSGAYNSSRYKGGTVKALNTGVGTTVSHGHCLGFTLSSAAASSGTSVATNKKVLVWFSPMGRISTGV